MTDKQAFQDYLAKAVESLAGAESEFANQRFNNCANRCYYACFQAAIAALLAAGVVSPSPGGRWNHDYIQAQFAGQLINRRKRYPAALGRVLADNILLRHAADYDADMTSEIQAFRALRRSREFVNAVKQEVGT